MRVKLLVVRGQPQGKRLAFPPGEFLIGRGSECHIRPDHAWVSRQHCQLLVTEDGVSIRDLGSTNGTLVNGTRILGEQRLKAGDRLQVGPLTFEVQLEPVTSALEPATTPMPGGLLKPEPTGHPLPQTTEMPNLENQLATLADQLFPEVPVRRPSEA
jgi:predicted component of type VI protein secretion system